MPFSELSYDEDNYNIQPSNGQIQISSVNQIQRYHLRTNETENNPVSNNQNSSVPAFIYANKNDNYQHHHLSQAHSSAYPSSTIAPLILNQNQSNQQIAFINSQPNSFGFPFISQNLADLQSNQAYQNSSNQNNTSSAGDQTSFSFAARLGHNLHPQMMSDSRAPYHHLDERNDTINNMNISTSDSVVNKSMNANFHSSSSIKPSGSMKNNDSSANINSWSPKNIPPANFLHENHANMSDQLEQLGNNGR